MSADKLQKLQPVRQTAASLSGTGAAAGSGPASQRTPAPRASGPPLAQRAAGLTKTTAYAPAPASCQQCVYVSLFFDGTGNNLKADEPTLEHSNVARLFRAMPLDSDARGVYSRYIPGIGTRFPAIGDDGRGWMPAVDTHNGMGAMGQDRLDYAFKELSNIVAKAEARAQNPTNKIIGIRLAVFGFSRGATLARAFVRDLLDAKLGKTVVRGDEVFWKSGNHPLSVEFMGLWDTVASVGVPMSANNVEALRSSRRVTGNLGRAVTLGLRHRQPEMLRAVDLAFGTPGADPSPGAADGHGAWADGLAISPLVKQCVHMIAAHEIRNSFPVDSVQRGLSRGANCREYVYPGAHSDVGGGYRPGEAGKGEAVAAGSNQAIAAAASVLGKIPLMAMYNEALSAGVPLLRRGTTNWSADNDADFAASAVLIDRFTHYMQRAGWGGVPLGQAILSHMRVFFAWRWHCMAKGRAAEARQVATNQSVFATDKAALERQKVELQRQRREADSREATARMQRDAVAQQQWMNPSADLQAIRSSLAGYDKKIAEAQAQVKALDDQLGELQARLDTAADDGDLWGNLSEYDAELRNDAQSILKAMEADKTLRARLRPHFRNLVETYEDEFVHGKGLTDEKIIAFFDDHVHDSLAGFARDSTLPSDPRVVYIGGDRKLDYARSDMSAHEQGVPA